jgi:16S rRNA (cytidine1402-2'-O)-methyltransferase
MPGILYVVATPIGNLEDVTLRALRILRDVSLIAAEDTRRTSRLLQHYSISTPTTSLHEHNERQKIAGLLTRLRGGASIALVSDAGTPLVSDPGQALVAAARDAGIRVESVPGPSAVTTALAGAGLPGEGFSFVGFPPSRAKDRKIWLQGIIKEPRVVVFFEAPHRILATLEDLESLVGPDYMVAVGRELTKTHEELVIQPIRQLLARFAEPRGEFTVLLPPQESVKDEVEQPSVSELALEVGYMTNYIGLTRRQAARAVGLKYGISPNKLYSMLAETSDDRRKR